MRRTTLGKGGISVSGWCLGTMTWGNQTPLDDALRQMDMAMDAGVTFWDTAEMYPVNPVRKETAGRSEEFVGEWLARRGRRDAVQIATKIAGPRNAIRGAQGPDRAVLVQAVEESLRRLRTDVIDLYQIHWPSRAHWSFRNNWAYDPSATDRAAVIAHMDEILDTLKGLVAAGKIRAFGLSNETAWGMTRWTDRAAATGGPRAVSIQNEYSLLCRFCDTDLAEVAVAEDITLLAFSPLAAGYLTGKYQGGALPEGSRMALNGDLGGRKSARAESAVAAYLAVAAEHGIDPVHMALAWQGTRPFPVIPILGATTAEQLERSLGGIGVTLTPEALADIERTHKAHPMPY